ncbi:hypothetical protein [Paenibacillus whitsoniae]|uniref:Uncharacterized protein n=1 Tax=Paenibacillus whitsoniae TaxID=2496558 RepID=A0A3S0CUX0_9BACL|nr:hypothetical protein [Paenibacillus whitsoniae]RTE09306.1 hypothetical protein EJQ19_13075 [Paenibacillus whitsoniae]
MNQELEAGREPVFTKEQLLRSTRWAGTLKDVLKSQLADGESYTHQQVEQMITTFLKRTVQ